MCGIVGVFSPTQSHVSLESALDCMRSRGPDSRATFRQEGVVLGHVRLAIIDLSDAANQPMTSRCGRYTIVFNGEIYNYRELKLELGCDFRTDSDTELILEAFKVWGSGCLSRFHGMFSFAIWDSCERQIFVARDRVGVKPLYYSFWNGGFYFASRPRALNRLIGKTDELVSRQSVRFFLESGFIPAPYSAFENLHKLQPGHFLVVSATGHKLQKYWSPIVDKSKHPVDAFPGKDPILELNSLLSDSVALRMVSSVDVGCFLSGGIDSSLIVSYMKEHSEKVKTFTIGFSDKSFDESLYARQVAHYLGTEHYEEILNASDLLNLLPVFFENYDEPFYDYSALAALAVSRLASKSVKVVLSGDGGDESFGGYHYYRFGRVLEVLNRLKRNNSFKVHSPLRLLSRRRSIKLIYDACGKESSVDSFAFMRSPLKEYGAILDPDLLSGTCSYAEHLSMVRASLPVDAHTSEIFMGLDFATTLPDDYLQKTDIASMAYSIEAREPLLDHKIIEWAAELPLKHKVGFFENKILLRKLAYRRLPRRLLDRPKRGFRVPISDWMKSELKDWCYDRFSDRVTLQNVGINHDYLMKLWKRHLSGETDAHTILWAVAVLSEFVSGKRGF